MLVSCMVRRDAEGKSADSGSASSSGFSGFDRSLPGKARQYGKPKGRSKPRQRMAVKKQSSASADAGADSKQTATMDERGDADGDVDDEEVYG